MVYPEIHDIQGNIKRFSNYPIFSPSQPTNESHRTVFINIVSAHEYIFQRFLAKTFKKVFQSNE